MLVKTQDLKEALQKSLKCATCNSFIPITNFCRIKELKDTFLIYTTDGINTLIMHTELLDQTKGASLDFVVDIKLLYQLISKTTSEDTSLYLDKGTLIVKADGKYSMPLPTDENDSPISFPEVVTALENAHSGIIYADNLRDIVKTNKSALPKTNDCADLNGYLFSGKTITTDSLVICENTLNLFDETVMFSPNVVDILCMFDDCISYDCCDGYYVFCDDNITFCSYCSDSLENFPIEAIESLLNTGFENSVSVSCEQLYNALDRINLFISPYDANACTIVMSDDKMTIKNQNNTCSEDIKIKNSLSFTFKVNIQFLMAQLKTMQDTVVLKFGNDKCISLSDEITNRMIALVS